VVENKYTAPERNKKGTDKYTDYHNPSHRHAFAHLSHLLPAVEALDKGKGKIDGISRTPSGYESAVDDDWPGLKCPFDS